MEFKSVPAEFQVKAANDGFQHFTGYASTWDRDLGGDTILPGAFTQTLADRLPKGLIKVRWMHRDPFGIMVSGVQDEKGLFVEGKAPTTPTNQERFSLMESGVVDKLSIGYDYPDGTAEYDENGRILRTIDLYEFSPVDLAMNENTSLQMVKSALTSLGFVFPLPKEVIIRPDETFEEALQKTMGILDENVKAGRVLSSANRTLVEQAVNALSAVLEADAATSDAGKEPLIDKWKELDLGNLFDDIYATISRNKEN